MSGRKTSKRKKPRFDVWPTPEASRDLKKLRGEIRQAAKQARQELAQSGCKAAHYRLTGEGAERICVRRLPRRYRVIIAFPAKDQVVILLVGKRSALLKQGQLKQVAPSKIDVYQRLYEILGIDVPDDEERHPPCCSEGQPPVDPDLVDRYIERSRELQKTKRRSRSRARQL